MRNAVLEETQVGIKIAGRNINNLRYADDTILMAESEEELKSLLMKVKEESEKVGLQLSIQKMKIMASGPITSWETSPFLWRGPTLEMRRECRKFFPDHTGKGSLLSSYNLPKLNQEEIGNMNRPTTSTEIQTVIKDLPTNKSPGPDGITSRILPKV